MFYHRPVMNDGRCESVENLSTDIETALALFHRLSGKQLLDSHWLRNGPNLLCLSEAISLVEPDTQRRVLLCLLYVLFMSSTSAAIAWFISKIVF